MSENPQSRKWALTINHPADAGLEHGKIAELLQRFSPAYYCMADEIATTGTYHTHIFVYAPSPMRFSTIKKRFPIAHIEKAYGTVRDNRDYIAKQGKWAETDKAETAVPGTFEEFGEAPSEASEKSPMMAKLIEDVQDGKSNVEIILDNPKLGFKVRDIDLLRQTLTAEQFVAQNRQLTVYYLYGATGAGKTRSIYVENDPREIYRVTNYRQSRGISFDGYSGQRVLVLEEFRGQIQIGDLLNYLDIYPLMLPARYNDRVACYTKVYITSNIPLDEQYPEIQHYQPATWQALCRRIHNIIEYLPNGGTVTHKQGGQAV